jgi:hypothetical protein
LSRSRGLYAALLAVAAGCAQPQPVSDDFENKPWEAQKAMLPPLPKNENLYQFQAGAGRPFAYFVDLASISVPQRGVLRYTLLARSSSGAANVSYEAIRCDAFERKTYAFGREDNTWSPARLSQWLPIGSGQDSPQRALASDFFCQAPPFTTTEEVVQTLKRTPQPTWLR